MKNLMLIGKKLIKIVLNHKKQYIIGAVGVCGLLFLSLFIIFSVNKQPSEIPVAEYQTEKNIVKEYVNTEKTAELQKKIEIESDKMKKVVLSVIDTNLKNSAENDSLNQKSESINQTASAPESQKQNKEKERNPEPPASEAPQEPETPAPPQEPETPAPPQEPETSAPPQEPETPAPPQEPEPPASPQEPPVEQSDPSMIISIVKSSVSSFMREDNSDMGYFEYGVAVDKSSQVAADEIVGQFRFEHEFYGYQSFRISFKKTDGGKHLFYCYRGD